jgi:SAM-dependent methyltransferase
MTHDDGAEFARWLAGQPQNDYLITHTVRFQETWRRAQAVLRGATDIVELGGISAIGSYLSETYPVRFGLITSDLRFGFDQPALSVDAVLVLEVLEHLNEAHGPDASIGDIASFHKTGARSMLRECLRILRPGGAVVLTTPNANSVDVIANILHRRDPVLYPPHVREYAPADVIAMATEAGFVTEASESFFAWNSHPQAVRDAIGAALTPLGYDMSDRGDDAFFIFRKPGAI